MPYIEWEYRVYPDDPERTKKEENEAAAAAWKNWFISMLVLLAVLFGVLAFVIEDIEGMVITLGVLAVAFIALVSKSVRDILKSNKKIRLFTSKEDTALLLSEAWKDVSKNVYCNNCGSQLNNTSKFCSKCGTEVGRSTSNKEVLQLEDKYQKFTVYIFDMITHTLRKEIKDIDVARFPPSKYADNCTYYAIESLKDGKKVRTYYAKDSWSKKIESSIGEEAT